MKKKKVNSFQNDSQPFVLSLSEFKALKHFLSPIELALFENKFQPFDYEMDGKVLHIDSHFGISLVQEIKRRITLFASIVRRERIKLAFKDTNKLLFLSSNIDKHGLPNNLIKKLNSKCILKIDQLASIGQDILVRDYRIDKTSAEQIRILFEKHKCEDLFTN